MDTLHPHSSGPSARHSPSHNYKRDSRQSGARRSSAMPPNTNGLPESDTGAAGGLQGPTGDIEALMGLELSVVSHPPSISHQIDDASLLGGGLPQRMGEELQRGTVELIDAAFAPGQYQALDVVVQQHNLNRVDVTSSMGQFRVRGESTHPGEILDSLLLNGPWSPPSLRPDPSIGASTSAQGSVSIPQGLHQPVSSQRVPKGKGDDGNVYERHRATRDERHNPVNDRLPTGVERFLSAFNQKFSQLFSSPGPGHENVQASSGPHQPEGGAYDGSQLTPEIAGLQSQGQPKKRKRATGENDVGHKDNEDFDGHTGGKKNPKSQKSERNFTCPYFRRFPDGSRLDYRRAACEGWGFPNISQCRQHLERFHYGCPKHEPLACGDDGDEDQGPAPSADPPHTRPGQPPPCNCKKGADHIYPRDVAMKIRSVTKMKGKKHTGYWKWGEIYALLFPGKVVPEERYVTVTAISQLSTEAQVGSRNPRGPGQDPLGDDPGEQRKRRPELRRQTLDFRPLPNNRMDEVRRDESQKIVEAVLAECSSRIFRLAASTDAPLVSQYPPCASEQGQRQSEPWREEFGYRLVSRIDEVLRDESQAIFRAVLAEQPQRWQQEFRHRLHGRIEEVQRDEGRGILPKVLTEHPSSLVFLQDTSADAYQASRPDGIQNSISTPSGMIPSPAPGLLAVSNNTDISADWDIEAYEF